MNKAMVHDAHAVLDEVEIAFTEYCKQVDEIIDRIGVYNTDYERGKAKVELLKIINKVGNFI